MTLVDLFVVGTKDDLQKCRCPQKVPPWSTQPFVSDVSRISSAWDAGAHLLFFNMTTANAPEYISPPVFILPLYCYNLLPSSSIAVVLKIVSVS